MKSESPNYTFLYSDKNYKEKMISLWEKLYYLDSLFDVLHICIFFIIFDGSLCELYIVKNALKMCIF